MGMAKQQLLFFRYTSIPGVCKQRGSNGRAPIAVLGRGVFPTLKTCLCADERLLLLNGFGSFRGSSLERPKYLLVANINRPI